MGTKLHALGIPGSLLILVSGTLDLNAQEPLIQRTPRPRFHGIALKQSFQLSSAWSYSYVDAVPPQTFVGTVDVGLGLGLQLSYVITPNLAPYFGVDLGSELMAEGGQSWVAYGPGLELRFPVSRLLLPYVSVGVTRWVHRDGLDFSYTQMTFGGGLELFLSGRLGLHYGFRLSSPVSDGQDHFGTVVKVDGPVRSHRFGLSWYLGRRGP